MRLSTYAPNICLPLEPGLAKAISNAIEAIGSEDFHPLMLDLLGMACPMDSGGAMMFFRNRSPLQLVHRFDPSERSLPGNHYLSGPYALDPFYQIFLQDESSGIYWLQDVTPDDFLGSEYYHEFFSKTGLSDEIEVLWRIDGDSALVFFLERGTRHPVFQPEHIAALRILQPIVFAASAQHHQFMKLSAPTKLEELTHRKVQSTIDNFARSFLTKRERQVLFYMLQGYSSGKTAESLATCEGTIKLHRKSIHRKLGIGSQAELFSLFVNCIPFATPSKPSDPLDIYRRQSILKADQ